MGRRSLVRGVTKLVAAAVAPALKPAPASAADAPVADMSLENALHVPERIIPVPRDISPEGQKFLANGARALQHGGGMPSPGTDKDAWRKLIVMVNKAYDPIVDKMLASPAKVERKTIGGANVCVGTPNAMRHPDRARMTMHKGGFMLLGGRYVEGEAAGGAAESGCVTFAVDYRMPPDFPFPTALDDCVAAYREIIKSYDPRKIAVSGQSAGANLTTTLTLKLLELGLPLPGALGMMTIPSDMSQMGDTLKTNFGVDTVLGSKLDDTIALYANGHDLKDPYLSPVFGDFTRGFPPSFLQSGTRDVLLSDTVRMHRALLKAGVEAELHVWEAMPHGGFSHGAPENLEIHEQFRKFMDKHLAG